MALQRDTRYPGRWTTGDAAHPQGAFKNRTAPGALDGSYIEQDWANDWDGFFSSLLSAASITPNGNVDAVGSSQYYAALGAVSQGRLARTLRYSRVAGVLNVSIDGGTNTTVGASSYTPPTNLMFIDIEAVGGGGAGGGAVNPTAGNVALGAPGASGSYGRSIFTAAQVVGAQAIVVGAGGVGVSAAAGGSGGVTSFGSLLTCPGGGGGLSSGAGGVAVPSLLGQTAAVSAPTGANLITITGSPGGPSLSMAATVVGSYGGQGGGSPVGSPTSFAGANTSGIVGVNYGSGASGVAVLNGSGPATGPSGAPGVIVIREYI